MLYDSKDVVLSFPPIINGLKTKVETSTRDLFVDVTSTDARLGDEALAIVCSALADAGGALETVTVSYGKKKVVTPQLAPSRMKFDGELAQAVTGLSLTKKEMKDSLRRSRLDLDPKGFAVIPSYRVDILHQVDLAEEVVIGYGLDKMTASYPPSSDAGQFDPKAAFLERMCLTMAEAGFDETMSFDLVDGPSLYGNFGRSPDSKLEVDNPRTAEHSLLRDSLLPSLMAVLGRNTKNEYPQRVFEAGKVFARGESGVTEGVSIAGALCALVLLLHRGQDVPRGARQEALRRGRRHAARVALGVRRGEVRRGADQGHPARLPRRGQAERPRRLRPGRAGLRVRARPLEEKQPPDIGYKGPPATDHRLPSYCTQQTATREGN